MIDRFDRVFALYFQGLAAVGGEIIADIPEDWLKKPGREVPDAGRAGADPDAGRLDKLLETLRQRLAEQKERHQGGNKWIGTAGTSPFGAYGDNPEGIRIGQDEFAPPPRRQGLGQARVPRSRRRCRARHPRA